MRITKTPQKTVIKRVVQGVFLTLKGAVNTIGFSSSMTRQKGTVDNTIGQD